MYEDSDANGDKRASMAIKYKVHRHINYMGMAVV